MSCNLSMVEEKLPPGFRFHPKDDELICDYLMKKLLLIPSSSSDSTFTLLLQVDLNKCEPWDLPVSAFVGGKEWYFYSQRDRKYATGLRTNRATVSGYWKATGKDRAVARQGRLVGMRKTLVFYQGRAPKGTKTDWVMHEFRLEGPLTLPKLPSNSKEEDWVLCRVFHKSRESTPPKRSDVMNGHDESGCSSLPDLMDTYAYISFEQTPQHNEDDYVDDNNINNANENSLVPSFSNPNTNPSSSSPLFHVAPSQHVSPYSAPEYANNNQVQQDGSSNAEACDRHVINAVLSQLSSDVKDSTKSQSEVRITDGGGGTERYYSDVGFPTMSMWTSHHSHY